MWGFLSGSLTVLITLSMMGRPLSLGPFVSTMLAGAGAVSLVGGYVACRASGNKFTETWTTEKLVVMELKYGRDDEPDANAVCNEFPHRVSRNSKYVTGIDLVLEAKTERVVCQ